MKKLCKPFMVEDKLQIFAVHTGGGGLGMFLTACFARCVCWEYLIAYSELICSIFSQQVVGLDGYSTIPDWSIAKRLRYVPSLLFRVSETSVNARN
jgi:Amt family ammonium transporter